EFRFDSVAPGSYSVEVRHPGFKPANTPLRVTNRPPAALRVVLLLAELESSVDVGNAEAAQVSTDASENRDTATVSLNLLERIPVFDHNVLSTMSAFLDR